MHCCAKKVRFNQGSYPGGGEKNGVKTVVFVSMQATNLVLNYIMYITMSLITHFFIVLSLYYNLCTSTPNYLFIMVQ